MADPLDDLAGVEVVICDLCDQDFAVRAGHQEVAPAFCPFCGELLDDTDDFDDDGTDEGPDDSSDPWWRGHPRFDPRRPASANPDDDRMAYLSGGTAPARFLLHPSS